MDDRERGLDSGGLPCACISVASCVALGVPLWDSVFCAEKEGLTLTTQGCHRGTSTVPVTVSKGHRKLPDASATQGGRWPGDSSCKGVCPLTARGRGHIGKFRGTAARPACALEPARPSGAPSPRLPSALCEITCVSAGHRAGPRASAEETRSFIQGPRGQKAGDYNHVEEGGTKRKGGLPVSK